MDIAQSISLVGTGIETAGKVVSFFKSFRAESAKPEEIAAANDQLLQVKEALYTAKDTIFVLKDEVAQMVDRIKELEHRLAQRDAHSLTKISDGAFAYVRSDAAEAVKGGPWLCQPCFEEGKQSVFQLEKRDWHFDLFQCPRCKATIQVPNDNKPTIATARIRNRFDDF